MDRSTPPVPMTQSPVRMTEGISMAIFPFTCRLRWCAIARSNCSSE